MKSATLLTTRVVSELPDEFDLGIAYLVGAEGRPWQVALLCPCGCRGAIHLNLLPPGPPLWRAELDGSGELTLSPSIWRTVGCCSHFSIRRGRVVWSAGRNCAVG